MSRGAQEEAVVGVLALQGDVREHALVLTALGARVREVRTAADLIGLDGLVLPGGESSVIDRLARILGVHDALREAVRGGLPVYGTCAGMILLAERIANPITGQGSFGGLDITVERNAFGGQVNSFETELAVPTVSADPVHAVFIRAPAVVQLGEGVEVLASVPADRLEDPSILPDGGSVATGGQVPVAVRQGSVLATSFHPEVTGDWSFHRWFLETMVRPRRSAGRQ